MLQHCFAAEIVSRNSSVIYESSPDSPSAWGCSRWWINIHFWVSVYFKKRTFSRFSFLLLLFLSQPFISLVFLVVLYFKRTLSLCLVFLFVRLYHRWTVRVCELYCAASVTPAVSQVVLVLVGTWSIASFCLVKLTAARNHVEMCVLCVMGRKQNKAKQNKTRRFPFNGCN